VNHSKVRARLSSFIERDLPEHEHRKVADHLEGCESCTHELRDLEQAVALLRALPEPEMPLAFTDSVMARIRDGEAEPGGLFSWLSRILEPTVLVPAALVLTAFVFIRGGGQPAVTKPDAGATVVAHATAPAAARPGSQHWAGIVGGTDPENTVPDGWVSLGTVATGPALVSTDARREMEHRRQLARMQLLARSGRIHEAAGMLRGANHPNSPLLADQFTDPHEVTVVEAGWAR
jgi:anti-sigma factor RsiW